MCLAGKVKQYLHGWGLLSERGRLPRILLPGHLELLGRGGGGGEGFWDGGLVRLLLPLGFLLLKVTVQRQRKDGTCDLLRILLGARESRHSRDYSHQHCVCVAGGVGGGEWGATKENLKLRTRQPVPLFSGFANNSAQKRSRCESVCLGESDCVWAAEGLERNLALDFTSDWPTFRIKKKIGSDIPFLYALWFLLEEFYDWRSKCNGCFFFCFCFSCYCDSSKHQKDISICHS